MQRLPDPVQPQKLAKLVEGKEEGPYYITGVKYTAQAGVRKDADTKKLVGVASNTTKKNPDPTAFKARLYNRKPIRFLLLLQPLSNDSHPYKSWGPDSEPLVCDRRRLTCVPNTSLESRQQLQAAP